jgi:hypothetical protein
MFPFIYAIYAKLSLASLYFYLEYKYFGDSGSIVMAVMRVIIPATKYPA